MTKFYFGAMWLCMSAAHSRGDGPQTVGEGQQLVGGQRLFQTPGAGETGQGECSGIGAEGREAGRASPPCNHPQGGRAREAAGHQLLGSRLWGLTGSTPAGLSFQKSGDS